MAGGIAGRGTNRLTDLAVRKWLKAGGNDPTKLFDGGGLYLTCTEAGTAVWRVKYRIGTRESVISVGRWPDVGLKAARAEREAVKTRVRAGRDPVQARRLDRAAAIVSTGNTFAEAANGWLERKKTGWSPATFKTRRDALDRDVTSLLGPLPVADITPAMVVSVIDNIIRRGKIVTAKKVLWSVSCIFQLAQALGWCRDNPALPVREILPRAQGKRRPAFLTWKQLGDVLRRARAANLSRAVHTAHRLCAFTAARMSNVIRAEWSEFDLDANLWVIPRAKMKARERHQHDHKIILAAPILDEIRAWKALTGLKGYLFPAVSGSGEHITPESIEKAYRETLELKDQHTPHGWRAAFSTLAKDHGFEHDVVELALDHVHDTDVVRAYDRGERLEKRVILARWWSEQLSKAEHS